MSKYKVGQRVRHHDGCVGEIIPTFKMPDDICIDWGHGERYSYDEDWLDEEVSVIDSANDGSKFGS